MKSLLFVWSLLFLFGNFSRAQARVEICSLDLLPGHALLALADRMLSQGRAQEGIWLFRENGDSERADEIERNLVHLLATGNEVRRKILSHGLNNDGRVFLDNGISGIFKSGPLFPHEIGAFQLDRLIALDEVPVTIPRKLGNKEGSLQIWMSRAVDGMTLRSLFRRMKGRWNGVSQRSGRRYRLAIYLMDLQEPYGHNRLFTPDAREPSIDSSLGFSARYLPDWTVGFEDSPDSDAFNLEEIQPSRKTYLLMKALDFPTLREKLGPYLREISLRSLYKRTKLVVEAVDRKIALQGEEAVFGDDFDQNRMP